MKTHRVYINMEQPQDERTPLKPQPVRPEDPENPEQAPDSGPDSRPDSNRPVRPASPDYPRIVRIPTVGTHVLEITVIQFIFAMLIYGATCAVTASVLTM